MKSSLIMLSLLALSFIGLFFILALLSKSGHPPGLQGNQLSPCPNKPNCVCSEFEHDEKHYIAAIPVPIAHHGDVMTLVKSTITLQGGSIRADQQNYLAASFSSDFFGFVDDFEVRFDSQENLLHLRSAARTGYSDMGVNRQRAELISRLIQQQF